MNLRQLASFVGVYEEGSFNKAARRLHATQSGLSMQIQNLEAVTGVTLFERSARGVAPTVAGRKLYARAIEILREMEKARAELSTLAGDVTGTLRVGLMPTFTRGVLAPALASFTRDYRHVELKIVEAYSAVLTEAVAAGELDFAVVPRASPREGVRSRHLGTDKEMLVAGAGQGLAHLAPADFRVRRSLKLVLPARGNARRDGFEAFAEANGLSIEAIMDMDAMIATLEFVANSDWMTILPATICSNDLDGRVRTLHPILDPPLTVDYRVIEAAKGALSPAATLFLDRLEQEYRVSDARWAAILEVTAQPVEP
ncbi:LysR family transcriptional regulator [Antarcticirhabdus aurantiaca]|uniref:LysR family transcriptional regulator n=1 Tax=Antarcticirhabdus aurantiaca TaxID=2606717 RepID=A0ACD4NHY8_9HYPH|nr:LysR family transcriptional regulator [Antarcticirhabdus aurantiaca]WAJ26393.1 LysR family transcriptional regulator [Jeongeuplla avenae]